MRKNFKEEREESKIIFDDNNISTIHTILSRHDKYHVQFQKEEIPLIEKSLLKIVRMSKISVEESILFALIIPEVPLYLKENENQHQILKQQNIPPLSKEIFGHKDIESLQSSEGNIDNLISPLHFTTERNSDVEREITLPIQNYYGSKEIPSVKYTSFITQHYNTFIDIWYGLYVLMILIGSIIFLLCIFFNRTVSVASYLNLFYLFMAFEFKLSLVCGIAGIKIVYDYNDEINSKENKKTWIKEHFTYILSPFIGLTAFLLIYVNFIWGDVVMRTYIVSTLYFNYLCLFLLADEICALLLNYQMKKDKINAIRNDELTQSLLQ